MLRLLGTVVFVTGVLLVSACSSDEEEPVKYPTVDSFCDARAKAECDTIAAKCGAKVEACVAARKTKCQSFVSTAQVGTRTYQPKGGEGCVDKAKEVYGKSIITPTDTKELEETCQKAFRGTKEKLQACASAGDCSGDLICDKTVCADKAEKKTGEFCGNPGEVCDASSYCTAAAGGSLQCAAKKGKGDLCTAKDPCTDALRCNNTCGERFASGEACASDGDCGTGAPFCDTYNGNKCSAGIIAAPGTPVCKAEFGGG